MEGADFPFSKSFGNVMERDEPNSKPESFLQFLIQNRMKDQDTTPCDLCAKWLPKDSNTELSFFWKGDGAVTPVQCVMRFCDSKCRYNYITRRLFGIGQRSNEWLCSMCHYRHMPGIGYSTECLSAQVVRLQASVNDLKSKIEKLNKSSN